MCIRRRILAAAAAGFLCAQPAIGQYLWKDQTFSGSSGGNVYVVGYAGPGDLSQHKNGTSPTITIVAPARLTQGTSFTVYNGSTIAMSGGIVDGGFSLF